MTKFIEPMSPLTPDEDRDAGRFADALDALEGGRDPGIDPREDPELSSLLRTAEVVREAAADVRPRMAYRTRSHALLVEAVEAGRRRVRLPFYNRRSFLVPFASAAAAAGITIAAVLGATAAGLGPAAGRGANVEPIASVSTAANLTQLSIQEDLKTLQSTLDAVVAAAARGEDLDPRLLRSITENTLMVTSLIESSPGQLPTDEVISYMQTAASTRIKLTEIAPTVSPPALVAAQQASEDGVVVAARHLAAVQERMAAGQIVR